MSSANTTAHYLRRVDELFERHACTGVYLDVGSNVGVQIRKLFEPHKYEGAGVLPLFSEIFGDASRCNVCAVGVEPNPRHRKRLDALERRLSAAGAAVVVLRAAAATASGVVYMTRPGGFANDIDAHIESTQGSSSVAVDAIDLAALVHHVHAKLRPEHAANFLMKMDVEGAEVSLLPHLIRSGSLCLPARIFFDAPERIVRGLTRRMRKADGACATRFVVLDDESYNIDTATWPHRSVCDAMARARDVAEAEARAVKHLVRPRPGFCGATLDGSDCDHRSTGSWRVGATSTLEECVKRARQCPAAHYVSFSAQQRDCSWYTRCQWPLSHSYKVVNPEATYSSVAVRWERDDDEAWPGASGPRTSDA